MNVLALLIAFRGGATLNSLMSNSNLTVSKAGLFHLSMQLDHSIGCFFYFRDLKHWVRFSGIYQNKKKLFVPAFCIRVAMMEVLGYDQRAFIIYGFNHNQRPKKKKNRYCSTSCLAPSWTLSRWRDSAHCCVNAGIRSTYFQQGRATESSRWESRTTNGRRARTEGGWRGESSDCAGGQLEEWRREERPMCFLLVQWASARHRMAARDEAAKRRSHGINNSFKSHLATSGGAGSLALLGKRFPNVWVQVD